MNRSELDSVKYTTTFCSLSGTTKLVTDNLCSCKVLKQMVTYIVIYIDMTTGSTRRILDTIIPLYLKTIKVVVEYQLYL